MFDYKERLMMSDYKYHYVGAGDVVRTTSEVYDGDFKTVIAHNIPPIPKGTELVVHKCFCNFYGNWVRVFYMDRCYDIDPMRLEYVASYLDREKEKMKEENIDE